MLRIGVLISGGGTNLQSIIDAVEQGILDAKVECVISDREGVYGLERAKKHGIKALVVDRKIHKQELSNIILGHLKNNVDIIVLAGFLSILKGEIIQEFKDRIVNIHPSLIPSFCGNGMYGLKVHEHVIKSGVKVSGCTVHFVDEFTDNGPIIIQRTVPVYFEDDAETLQKRVLVEEHKALPEALRLIGAGKIEILDNKVKIISEV